MASKTIYTCDLCGNEITSGEVAAISFETMVSPTIYGHAITPYRELCWNCKYTLLSEMKKAYQACVSKLKVTHNP